MCSDIVIEQTAKDYNRTKYKCTVHLYTLNLNSSKKCVSGKGNKVSTDDEAFLFTILKSTA